MRVVVVEDEPAIADFVTRGLRRAGYEVEHAADGPAGERLILQGDADIAILDLMLPGRDGLDVLRNVRKVRPSLPVIILSARDEVADRVSGLEEGATDYVGKPFAFEELLARVRAHLRTPGAADAGRLRVGRLELYLLAHLVWNDGTEVALSPSEFALLSCFARNQGQVLSRGRLLNEVWGYDHDPGTNVVDVYVGYLRRKLRPSGGVPLETIRAAGYRLAGAER
jgi:DNA-binding response OmpR family regulator